MWGWDAEGDLVSASQMIQRAMMGLLPKRHSDLVRHCPNELVLRVKHKVLSEEKGLDKLRPATRANVCLAAGPRPMSEVWASRAP